MSIQLHESLSTGEKHWSSCTDVILKERVRLIDASSRLLEPAITFDSVGFLRPWIPPLLVFLPHHGSYRSVVQVHSFNQRVIHLLTNRARIQDIS